jgi:solute carrier family 35 protein F5
MVGDLLGFISAIGYGAYAVQTRIYCPKNESLYSMQTLLGYIGLCNFVVLSPFAFYVLLSGESSLTWVIFGFLVLKGLFDNVLSDYLWLRAVILTNATTATVGLGLTIPLAFASDILLGKQSVLSTEQLVGAITVLVGFVLVNIGNNNATDNTTEMGPTTATNTNILTTGGGYDQIPITIDEDNSQRGQEIVSLPPLHVIS